MTTRIANNATERIRVTAVTLAGAGYTGLGDVLIEVRRKSDDLYLDFNDDTFKVSGWTTRQATMTEMDATNSAGTYYYDFDTSPAGFVDNDEYYVRCSSVTAPNGLWEGEIKTGGLIDEIKDLWQFKGLDPNNTGVITGDGVTESVIDVDGKTLTITPNSLTRT